MPDVLMSCGCRAMATNRDGQPSCVTHHELNPRPVVTPDLSGRFAECSCGRREPSSVSLAFFEFRGEGSLKSREICRNCAYLLIAHTSEVMARNKALKCRNFVPHGPYETDRFYCGCRGWD